MASFRFSLPSLNQRPSWVPFTLILLLWLLAGGLVAQLFWQLWAPAGSMTPPMAASTTPIPERPAEQSILDAHLFGQTPRATADAAIQASTLNLPLLGILSGQPKPLVMLGVGSTIKVFGVGETVEPGVSIDAIEPQRVLLQHNGRIEALSFAPAPALNTAPAPSVAGLPGATTAAAPAPASAPAAVRQQVQQVLKQPQSLLSLVRISPVQQNGALSGYALSPVPGQEGFLRALGLHPGDVITAVDGMPLTNPAALPTLMPRLNSGQPLTLLVERGGLPMTVSINLDTLQ